MKYDLLAVGAAGFVGSVSRYLVYVWIGSRNTSSFPYTTLIVNLAGCFLIGAFSLLIERAVPQHRTLFLVGSVGFLGAFTTFSAFGLETLNLLRNQQPSLAIINALANVLFGIAAVWLGRILTAFL